MHPNILKLDFIMMIMPTATLRSIVWTIMNKMNEIVLKGRIIFEVEI